MEHQPNLVQVPQDHLERMNAQIQETHLDNQRQAQVMAGLQSELNNARLLIEQIQLRYSTPTARVEALKVEPVSSKVTEITQNFGSGNLKLI